MSRLRGLLPLFLCAAVLAAGAALPQLLLRHTPDYKNAPETIAIAGRESPLYLENPAGLRLPPWDAIELERAVSCTALFRSGAGDAQRHAAADVHILACLTPFGAAAPAADVSFSDGLQIHNNLIFLRDFEYTAASGRRCAAHARKAARRPW